MPLVIEVEGGMVVAVYTDDPGAEGRTAVWVVDRDTEGVPPDECVDILGLAMLAKWEPVLDPGIVRAAQAWA